MYVSRYNVIVDVEGHKKKIVINPLSQSIDAVEGEEKDLLSLLKGEGSFENMEDSDLEYLLSRGYLFNSAAEEENRLHEVIKKDEHEDYPCDFLLYPTFHCNLRCTYCFQEKPPTRYSMISKPYLEKAFEAIEKIHRNLKAESTPFLYLFGGEPLLKGRKSKEIVYHTLSLAHKKEYKIAVVTNGSNLGSYSDMLKEYTPEFIHITLDGPKHIHDIRRVYANGKGTFDDIVRGIESIIDSEIKILVRVNLDSQNIDFLPEFADFVLDLGWDRDNITVFVGPYRDLSCRNYEYQMPEHVMLKKLFSFYEKNPCTRVITCAGWPGVDYIVHFLQTGDLPPPRVSFCIANYGRFGLDADGYVYACGNIAGRKEYAIGRYYPEVTFYEDEVSKWRRRTFMTMPHCKECSIALLCGGGCTHQSLLKYGGRKPFCPEIFENLQAAVTYYYDRIIGE
jgi:uncharacterized protein